MKVAVATQSLFDYEDDFVSKSNNENVTKKASDIIKNKYGEEEFYYCFVVET